MALVACMAAAAPGATRELRSVSIRAAPDGQTVLIELSARAEPRFAVVPGEGTTLRRIHVDLPAGTALKAGAVQAIAPAPPIMRIRVGLVDGDHVRVVLDLEGAEDYRVEPQGPPSVIALTVLGAGPPPAAAAAAPPPAPPAPAATGSGSQHRPDPKESRPKIVLDPGHGGDDPGAQGHAIEKEVTLDIAQRLARLLRTRLGAVVVLTRTDDATLALKDRTARANAEGADLFVSIHANASETGRLRGVETYVLDNSTDRGTLRLAKMENGLDLLKPKPGETGLRYILSDLVQMGKMGESVQLARSIQQSLVGRLRRRYTGTVDLGVKRGPFYVLVGAYMPCVLVETAFLTHPIEGRRLARATYRADVAQGVYDGIARYLRADARRRTL